MPKLTLTDCVYLCMKNREWWTFWGSGRKKKYVQQQRF